MRVVERLARREATWQELDHLLAWMEGRRIKRAKRVKPKRPDPREVHWIDEADLEPEPDGRDEVPPPVVPSYDRRPGAAELIRMAELYRAACADLMLAEAHDLPRETVAYLHDLVARAHNALYRSRGFHFRGWVTDLAVTVPRRLRRDPALRLSALVFYGGFLIFGLLAAARPEVARHLMGEAYQGQLEQMYAEPIGSAKVQRYDAAMAGFYIQHNAGIGLQCFAWGLTLGIGTLYTLLSNAIILGASFGHMARTPMAGNFYTFVTAHGPFELTAIVFSGAAGLRLGYGVLVGLLQWRLAPLRDEAARCLPTVGAAVLLFVLAAFLEGFVSASALPYVVKAGIALASAATLLTYLVLGGRGRRQPSGV